MIRTLGAVLAGYLLMAGLAVAADLGLGAVVPEAFHSEEHTIDQPWLTVSLCLAFASAVAGGWLTARLAPRAGLGHALALAGLLMCLWLVTVLLAPARSSGPYLPLLQPIGVLGVLTGGGLFTFRSSRHRAST